jgi:hypothetical protein
MDAEITTRKEPVSREVDSTILSARSFYQHDPLLVLLKDKLHLGTLWTVVGGFFFTGLFFPCLSYQNSTSLTCVPRAYSIKYTFKISYSMLKYGNGENVDGRPLQSSISPCGITSCMRWSDVCVSWIGTGTWIYRGDHTYEPRRSRR